jgi:hypothetical protein
MTALAADRTTDKYAPGHVAPPLLNYPVKGSTKLYAGSMVALTTGGYLVPASSDATLKIVGRCPVYVDNSAGADGAKRSDVELGVFYFNTPSSGANQILAANAKALCYASDDNTVNLTDGAGLYPAAGTVEDIRADGQIAVWLGNPSLYAVNPEITSTTPAFVARAVITVALAAYTAAAGVITANANGAIGSVADGVTLVAGDTVLLPEGIAAAAADAGPYIVTALGGASAKFVLTRPDWWAHGSLITRGGRAIDVGPEGAVFEGSQWRSFVTTALKVVGTDAPLLWPRNFRKTVTLVAGTVTLGSADFLALRSTTRSMVEVTRNTPNTSTATTGGYQSAVANRTAGAIGTGALTIIAAVAAGTINNADISTLDVLVTNW